MRYFFVDYENVKRLGLSGISELTETDCVKIYYSENAETLTWGMHRKINESKATFEYIKVKEQIKNALDCKIIFDIRDLIRNDKASEYYIVAVDKDYDYLVDELTANDIKICKISAISEYSHNAENNINTNTKTKLAKPKKDKRELTVRSFFGQNLKEYSAKKEEIIDIILTAKTRQEINNRLQKQYSNDKVKDILKRINPLTKDMAGQ